MCRKHLADDARVARLLLAASFVVVLSLLGSAVRANAELPQRAAPRIGIGQVSIDGQQGCAFGYRQSGMECRAFAVPPHAYITPEGDSWDCDRGFHAAATTCVRISLPANAHLDFTGNAWNCNWGFEAPGPPSRMAPCPHKGFLCNLCRTGAARAPAHGGSYDGCAVGMIAICWRLTRFGRDTVNAMASATSSDFSHSTCDLEPSSQSIAP